MSPLSGRTVAVTRAAEQSGRLVSGLVALGAEVIELPLIAVIEPVDGGHALRGAVARLGSFDWLLLTSPNGAERVAELLPLEAPPSLRIGTVGAATAAALGRYVDVVARTASGQGLLDELPSAPARALVVQAEVARPELVDGLIGRGWDVERVVAYRTVASAPAEDALARALAADAITFASGSAVQSFVETAGSVHSPPAVVCIGPTTSEIALAHGLSVAAVADPHTIDGLLAAVCRVLAPHP
jgi:uroporphyrinogen-III synthase